MRRILVWLALLFAAAAPGLAQTATPVISPAGGTYPMPLLGGGGMGATITDSTSGATITYCYSGAVITSCSGHALYTYSGAIYVNPTVSETICAYATASGVQSATTSPCTTYTPSSGATGDGRAPCSGSTLVCQPQIPASTGCTPVPATKYLVYTTTVDLDPFNPSAGSGFGGTGTRGTMGATGGTSIEPSSCAGTYNVATSTCSTGYSANETLDTAIQTALNLTSSTCVELVPGSGGQYGFVVGQLNIPTGNTLVVDPGIDLDMTRNPGDLDNGSGKCGTMQTGTSGITSGCYPWITSPGTTGSGIMGFGRLNARAWDRFTTGGNGQSYYSNNQAAYCFLHSGPKYGSPGCTPGTQGEYAAPNAINLIGSINFTFYGITLRESPGFGVLWQGPSSGSATTGLTVWNYKYQTPAFTANTDGIDPTDNTQNFTVAYSYFDGGDDIFSFKAASSSYPTKNGTVSNVYTYGGDGISIGSAANGISNLLITNVNQQGNLNFSNSAGLKIKSSLSNGGPVSGITYQNICEQNQTSTVWVYSTYGQSGSCTSGSSTPVYTGITYNSIHVMADSATGTNSGTFTFQGLNSSNKLAATFNNFVIDGTNQGIATNCSQSKDQYATLTLGPGIVDSSLLSQFSAGTSVTTTGSSGSSTTWPCSAASFPPLVGTLLLQTSTLNNQTSFSTMATSASYTLQAIVQPTREYPSIKEAYTPAECIQFYDNGSLLGCSTLGANGTLATWPVTAGSGTHVYTIQYPAGDANYPQFCPTCTNNFSTSVTATIATAAATPVITLAAGTYTFPQSTTITDSTSGSSILTCTVAGTGGCTPVNAYSGAIMISTTPTQTVCANATAPSYAQSATACSTYTSGGGGATVATPVFTTPTGTYSMPLNGGSGAVITDSTSGSSIFYCYSGGHTCTPGTSYIGAITVNPVAIEYLCANATAPGDTPSATACVTYTNAAYSPSTGAIGVFTPGP
jgi:polygalacturonase